MGGAVSFHVYSDWSRSNVAGFSPCGDGVVEECDPYDPGEIPDVTCNSRDQEATFPAQPLLSEFNAGIVDFSPGQDGAYLVIVGAGNTGGHIWT